MRELDGAIVLPKRLSLAVLATAAVAIAAAAFAYAGDRSRLAVVEEKVGKVDRIDERTIRMEEQLGFIRRAIEGKH